MAPLHRARETAIIVPLFERATATTFSEVPDLGDLVTQVLNGNGFTFSHDFTVTPTAKGDPRRWRCLFRHQPNASTDDLQQLVDEVMP